MNRWTYQQNALMESYVADGVVCPKPRRIGGASMQFYEPLRPPSRLFHINNQQTEDARAGMELLDIIHMKGNYNSEMSSFQVAASPPFFAGSPPSRASNPMIQDQNFCNNPPSAMLVEAPSSTHRSGGCTRVNFGSNPPPVRVEGFNCPGSCSISAVA